MAGAWLDVVAVGLGRRQVVAEGLLYRDPALLGQAGSRRCAHVIPLVLVGQARCIRWLAIFSILVERGTPGR